MNPYLLLAKIHEIKCSRSKKILPTKLHKNFVDRSKITPTIAKVPISKGQASYVSFPHQQRLSGWLEVKQCNVKIHSPWFALGSRSILSCGRSSLRRPRCCSWSSALPWGRPLGFAAHEDSVVRTSKQTTANLSKTARRILRYVQNTQCACATC